MLLSLSSSSSSPPPSPLCRIFIFLRQTMSLGNTALRCCCCCCCYYYYYCCYLLKLGFTPGVHLYKSRRTLQSRSDRDFPPSEVWPRLMLLTGNLMRLKTESRVTMSFAIRTETQSKGGGSGTLSVSTFA
jgi:hypothetical protein